MLYSEIDEKGKAAELVKQVRADEGKVTMYMTYEMELRHRHEQGLQQGRTEGLQQGMLKTIAEYVFKRRITLAQGYEDVAEKGFTSEDLNRVLHEEFPTYQFPA